MKQQLLDFLGDSAESYCSKIEEAPDGIFVYGTHSLFTQSALTSLIKFARLHKLHYFVSTCHYDVYMHLYKED